LNFFVRDPKCEEPHLTNYLMITNDTEHFSGSIYSAFELIFQRFELKRWDLNERTRFRKVIGSGDRLAFYAAGKRKNCGHIIACARVGAVITRSADLKRNNDLLASSPVSQLELKDINIIEPINFKDKFFELEMSIGVRRTKKWGSALMGGAKKLSDNDWDALGLPQQT